MKRKAVFLDRDGVINEDVGYVGQIERFMFKDGIFDLLRRAQDCGYLLVIVTNQSGVGRGLFTQADYETLTRHMLAELRKQGIEIALTLACFTHLEAVDPALRRDSFWRKPNAGMILEAMARLNIDPARSVMLGDGERDIIAAQTAGLGRTILLGRDVKALGEVMV